MEDRKWQNQVLQMAASGGTNGKRGWYVRTMNLRAAYGDRIGAGVGRHRGVGQPQQAKRDAALAGYDAAG
jgi:hypothetical protein